MSDQNRRVWEGKMQNTVSITSTDDNTNSYEESTRPIEKIFGRHMTHRQTLDACDDSDYKFSFCVTFFLLLDICCIVNVLQLLCNKI